MLWYYWRKVQKMYNQKRLLQPGDDPAYPDGFFNKTWAGRGREYRMFVEPVDVANWCGGRPTWCLLARTSSSCSAPAVSYARAAREQGTRGAHCDNDVRSVRRYYKNKHVEALEEGPAVVSGHYVDFPDGRVLSRAPPPAGHTRL